MGEKCPLLEGNFTPPTCYGWDMKKARKMMGEFETIGLQWGVKAGVTMTTNDEGTHANASKFEKYDLKSLKPAIPLNPETCHVSMVISKILK